MTTRSVAGDFRAGLVLFVLTTGLWAPPAGAKEKLSRPSGLSVEEFGAIRDKLDSLSRSVAELRVRASNPVQLDAVADAAVFVKSARWALRYEPKISPANIKLLEQALATAEERVAALEASKRPWALRKGRGVRGYFSAVDGSVQPYGLILPDDYDSKKPIRLDVVLHGSSRPTGASELRFLRKFGLGASDRRPAPANDFIELHPLGRVENCYRWAGETDVFEAIESVCRNFRIDRDRIVLRGMSMGASGTWHLGLKHPDRFVALGPYCGYVDTHEFSKTPLKTFIRVGKLPPHQEQALHMLDSIDYAANAGVVPAIACIGEKDVFFQAHVLMGKAMAAEGLEMVNLISPGTGHVIDPVTHAEQMRRIAGFADKGLDRTPRQLRFVTWTLKYSRCHWLRVLGLERHYARAELNARVADDGGIDVAEPKNITRFSVRALMLESPSEKLRVAGVDVPLPSVDRPRELVIGRRAGKWSYLGGPASVPVGEKTPGLQGPIDDAFASPFLCVRGTGKPWNPRVQDWAEASLRRFADEWSRYMRGDLPIKDDRDVTEADVRRSNLILFGDPGSNSWIAKIVASLPIEWSRESLRMGGKTFSSAAHAPVMIHPNPLAPGKGRYVVLNSGHTFHKPEFSTLNYLLFPRLGDWAVMKLGAKASVDPSAPLDETPLHAGFFDEKWRLPSLGSS